MDRQTVQRLKRSAPASVSATSKAQEAANLARIWAGKPAEPAQPGCAA